MSPGPPGGFVVVGEGKTKDVSIETHDPEAGKKRMNLEFLISCESAVKNDFIVRKNSNHEYRSFRVNNEDVYSSQFCLMKRVSYSVN